MKIDRIYLQRIQGESAGNNMSNVDYQADMLVSINPILLVPEFYFYFFSRVRQIS